MPQMGESIAEGTIVRWIKKIGDNVDRDEPLFEISTDKVDAEIPSPAAGTLLEIKVKEGETVAVNSVVATIGAAGEKPAGPATDSTAGTAAAPSGKTALPSAQPDGTPAASATTPAAPGPAAPPGRDSRPASAAAPGRDSRQPAAASTTAEGLVAPAHPPLATPVLRTNTTRQTPLGWRGRNRLRWSAVSLPSMASTFATSADQGSPAGSRRTTSSATSTKASHPHSGTSGTSGTLGTFGTFGTPGTFGVRPHRTDVGHAQEDRRAHGAQPPHVRSRVLGI